MKKKETRQNPAMQQAMDNINGRFANCEVRVTGVSDERDAFFVRLPYTTYDTTVRVPLVGNTVKELEEPRPVPAGMSAVQTISTPDTFRALRTQLKMGCWMAAMSSTISVLEYFRTVVRESK